VIGFMLHRLLAKRRFPLPFPQWSEARTMPFREKSQVFAQDVDSKENTRSRRRDSNLA
jgi:hypothetical protein